MKKFKKALLSVLSLVLVAVLSIGGTLAYLKSEDSDVNVMTMGNVKIAQHEYERATNEDGSYKTDTIDNQTSYVLQKFTQDKPLYPIVGNPDGGYDSTEVRLSQLGHNSRGGMQILKPENVQDKFVVVENTGRSDAYVRTIVAFEAGSLEHNEWESIINYSFHFTWKETRLTELVEIDGKNYFVVEFVYNGYQDIQHPNGVLTPGDYTYNSLAQVYMYDTATNEDVEAIDGNGNGRFDILVLSQAVQTKGFANAKTALDTAFGETNATNAALWFAGMKLDVVTSVQGELIIDNDTIISLSADATATFVQNNGKNVIINGNGNKLTSGDDANYGLIARGGTTVISDVEFESKGGGVGVTAGKLEFNGTSLILTSTTTNPRYNFYVVGEGTELTINNGTFDFASKTLKRAYIYADAGTTVYVNGGTFGKASTRSGYTDGILGTGKVIITGGTFGFNPTTWVATGYTAVDNGNGTWTVQAE